MGQKLLNENGKIAILNHEIRIDTSLPKYQIIGNDEPNPSLMSYEFLNSYIKEQDTQGIGDFNIKFSPLLLKLSNVNNNYKRSLIIPNDSTSNKKKHINLVIKKIKSYIDKYREQRFDVIRFFSEVKIQTEEEMKSYQNRIKEYILTIGYAERSGQNALKEKLFQKMVICKYESILYSKGIYKAISEENLIKFAKGCPRNICLDYISDYTRIIPFETIKKKTIIDEYEVFDNYVILHYDSDNNSTEKTLSQKKEEIEKKKDPILFGIISGSNKLYYIDDWIDQYCDLQFDDIVKSIGNDIEKNDFLSKDIII